MKNWCDCGEYLIGTPHKCKLMPITMALIDLVKSGYAGVSSEGRIIDRRKYPDAIPIQKNTLLGVPEPKEIIPTADAPSTPPVAPPTQQE